MEAYRRRRRRSEQSLIKVWAHCGEKEKEKREVSTSEFRDRAPTAMAMLGDIIEKLFIFIWRPKSFPQLLFIAARVPSHVVEED